MAKGQSGRQKIVPESHQAIDQWKYEIAEQLGLPVGKSFLAANPEYGVEFATELGEIPTGIIREDYWGHIATRDTGAVGGAITRRLVQQAERTMLGM